MPNQGEIQFLFICFGSTEAFTEVLAPLTSIIPPENVTVERSRFFEISNDFLHSLKEKILVPAGKAPKSLSVI